MGSRDKGTAFTLSGDLGAVTGSDYQGVLELTGLNDWLLICAVRIGAIFVVFFDILFWSIIFTFKLFLCKLSRTSVVSALDTRRGIPWKSSPNR
jgi:hypothetical protein